MFKSWKTTTAGIAVLVGVLWKNLPLLWDDDPESMPDWNVVITGVLAFFGFAGARDNDLSSEKAGAK